ncbi:MAG: thiosulfate sulfurtransferase GlpE [Colwelliaceae bacterium]|nr:thiosulfate sulfurtransferase GlpE [Colwelliaceae bacterium]|tara:strand:- start:345 stop:674 length:330 start_codon:yes stop_codon:yes gene_type:complete
MSEQSNFTHLNAAQLAEKLVDEHFVVVDIRDANTFAEGRIPGAIHLTNDNISDFVREADFDKPTVVCCYHGISSQPAAEYLVSLDFSDVYSLDGGFVQWQSLYPEHIER